jgi:transposase-like protein
VSKKNIISRRKHTAAFRKKAVAGMQNCNSVVGLAKELGVHWGLLYKWRRRQLAEEARSRQDATLTQLAEVQEENAQLKIALGEKELDLRFFKGALQNYEARRRGKSASGERPSTTRSGR